MENYHILELIGEGSFGKVFKGRKKFSGQVVALKFIPKVGRSEKDLRNLRREIEIMRTLHHQNIIEMLDSFETDKEVVAVTDYAEGELFQILEDDGNLPESQVQSIACQLVSALFYLHSHRILHRDMKPQNILLGKGGVVKLCDFGFARAMSINTLVLTSIKGTPLYMSPELVEEKPYDHTADLWALGCILYELFTGQPPFYTNSIFQLVSLIIKDPVRWPKNMTPAFKDFLQGLLTKNPAQRLAWPKLLEHPFVAHGVTASEEDKKLPSPFTRAPTESLIMERDKQTKLKTNTQGGSKILSKAREKAEQEAKKKKQPPPAPHVDQPPPTHAWGKDEGEKEPLPVHPERPHTSQWEKTGASQIVQPTPRANRISQDYAHEFPSIEVESRKLLKKSDQKNIENVKLNEEDADSDDEWQGLVEKTDPEEESQSAVSLLEDKAFVTKLHTRLQTSSLQVLDGILEGASRLRPILRIISNLLMLKMESLEKLESFMTRIQCPSHIVSLMNDILGRQNVKEQPWCQQILADLMTTMQFYMVSDLIYSKDPTRQNDYRDACVKVCGLVPKLMIQKFDMDLRLRELTLLGVISLVETLEKVEVEDLPDEIMTGVSEQGDMLETLLRATTLEEDVMKRLEEAAEGDVEIAQQRLEEMVCLSVATLAALTHLPVHNISCVQGKKKVAAALGEVLCKSSLTDDYLLLLSHPSTCSNTLKALYSSSQSSRGVCNHLAQSKHMKVLLEILQGKVELADMECNSVLEMTLQLFNVIVVQLQTIPEELADVSDFVVGIFMESQLASHTAAAALLFSQMLHLGVSVEVNPEELLNAANAEFTDLSQICVRTPMEFGVLDGTVMLLYQCVAQGDSTLAGMFIETGIWNVLWHRLGQMLHLQNDMPLLDMEADTPQQHRTQEPDWSLVSFEGVLVILQIAVHIFTKDTFRVLPSLGNPQGIVTQVLMNLISPAFLQHIHTSFELRVREEGSPAAEIVLQITQICCFPFAVDTNEDLLANVQTSFQQCNCLSMLLHATLTYIKPHQVELPAGLMSRLVLGDSSFVDQFAVAVDRYKAHGYLAELMSAEQESLSVVCDMISTCSHMARTAPEHVHMIISIFKGPYGKFELMTQLLAHESHLVRMRTCSMLGNCMRHSSLFYSFLKTSDDLMKGLLQGLKDPDDSVRKGASYATGNAAFHSGDLYSELKPAIGPLTALLGDNLAKTRANAASALGNLAIHSNDLVHLLIQQKAVQGVLDVACRDSQYGVQECALTSLRAMCAQPAIKAELKKLKADEKLSEMRENSSGTSQGHRSLALSKSAGRHSVTTVMQHCARLAQILASESHC